MPKRKRTKKAEDRGKWGSHAEFILAAIGAAIGLGNVWRFPYLCYDSGGGAFLIPYFLCLFVAGIPVFYMELILGQFPGFGPNLVFRNLAPLFSGVGWSMATLSAMTSVYYNLVIAWAILYLGLSFDLRGRLMWDTCTEWWNTDRCYSERADQRCHDDSNGRRPMFYNKTCWDPKSDEYLEIIQHQRNAMLTLNSTRTAVSPAEEFFTNFVYDMHNLNQLKSTLPGETASFESLGSIRWYLAVCLLIAWIMCYLILFKGVRSIGKVVYFTATFPYVVLTILLLRGVTLRGAIEGVRYYMQPDFMKLTDAKVWLSAASQIFFSLSLSFGQLMTIASYNKFHTNCYRDTFIITAVNSFTSIYAGFAIFSTLGAMAHEENKPVSEVVSSGVALAFIAYPEAIVRMPYPPVWGIMFFFMLITLGIDSQFVLIEVPTTAILDAFPKLRPKKWLVLGVFCSAGYLLGLSMCLGGGMYLFVLADSYVANYGLILIALFEMIIVCYIYGINNFVQDIDLMLGHKNGATNWLIGPTGWYWRIAWMALAPVVLSIMLVMSFAKHSPPQVNGKLFPWPAELSGWTVSTFPLISIIVFAITMIVMYWKLSLPLPKLIQATPDWCPQYKRSHSKKYHGETGGEPELVEPKLDPHFDQRDYWHGYDDDDETQPENIRKHGETGAGGSRSEKRKNQNYKPFYYDNQWRTTENNKQQNNKNKQNYVNLQTDDRSLGKQRH